MTTPPPLSRSGKPPYRAREHSRPRQEGLLLTTVIYPAQVVRTMDPARPTAEAVAIRDGRIRGVGSLEELRAYADTTVDDRYADSVLFPGFVEAHSHIMGGSLWKHTYVGYYERVAPDGRRWSGCTTLEQVVDRLREADNDLPAGAPLIAWGLDPINFTGQRLGRRHLDAACPGRPAVVIHQSFHVCTVNSLVLRTDGITAETRVDGVIKDESGQPTGELREPVAMSLAASVPQPIGEGFDPGGMWRFGADAANHGITTLVDLGNASLAQDGTVAGLHDVVDDPDFPARVSVFHMGAGLAETVSPEEAVARLTTLRTGNTDKLRFGHVKLVLDGSIQSFTARLQPPGYLNRPENGIWLIPPPSFAEIFGVFHRAGLLVHVHCNGDEATELFLDTVEAELARSPRWDHRHTVTHSQLSTAAQYRRMANLGMCANVFSNHLWFWGDQHHDLTIGPDRASRMDAAATALRAGVPISLHSDSPVTPLDALATASYAASRRAPSGRIIGEHERISVPEALHAVTLGSAYMLKMDHEIGSLEAGKFADLAVLDRDPWVQEAAALRDIEVRGTVIGGCPVDTGSTLARV